MKAAILLLLIAGAAAAQFEETEQKLLECRQGCCDRMGGEWNWTQDECDVGASSYNTYYRCRNECLEIAGRDYGSMGGGSGICCAPALILATVAAFSLRAR